MMSFSEDIAIDSNVSTNPFSFDFEFPDPLSTEEVHQTHFSPSQKYEDYSERSQFYSLYMNICGRRQMQDRFAVYSKPIGSTSIHYFAVYDGHGTEKVAELLANKLHFLILDDMNFGLSPHKTIHNAFSEIDKEAIACENGGSVVLCAIIIENKLFVINLGDSRAILVQKDGHVIQLTKEHTPENPEECNRIEKLGGYVLNVGGKARVQGSLAVSRSLGDCIYKPFVSNCPDIQEYDLAINDRFLVLGTDGLWNECSNEEVGYFLSKKNFQDCSKQLLEEIVEKKGFIEDNTTILCVDLQEIKKGKSH